MPRKNKGRQKVEMMKMSNESNLQVTFSKRRSGLFKKASELCTLCRAEVAIIVFSPGRKVFSFGHPCVDMIIDRFNSQNPPHQSSGTVQVINAYRNANIRELNLELTKVLGELEFEKKRGEELKRLRKASEDRFWWESPVEGLSLAQLDQLKASLVDLRKDVTKHAENTMILSSHPHFVNPLQFANPHQFPNPSQFGSGGGFPPVDGPNVNNLGSDSKMNLKGLNNSGNGSGFH